MKVHCWHATGEAMTMGSTTYSEVKCCFCRKSTSLHHESTGEIIAGHGPYGPRVQQAVYRSVGPCVERA